MARGFTQEDSVAYNEIFSPVVKHSSIRILLALVENFDIELDQMDVKTIFLHGVIKETIYLKQPEGFEDKDKKDHLCLLKRALYGLKQSPKQWNKCFDEFMMEIGFQRSSFDSCVYVKKVSGVVSIYLLLYVYDMLLANESSNDID